MSDHTSALDLAKPTREAKPVNPARLGVIALAKVMAGDAATWKFASRHVP